MEQDDKQILLMLAWLFLQHGQVGKAEALCAEIQRQEPGEAASAAILANLHVQNANPDKALKVLENTTFPPDMNRAIALLKGRALMDLGRQDQARQIWRDFLNQATHNSDEEAAQ